MPAKPVRVIVSLDRSNPSTPGLFDGMLAVARRRGWRLLDDSAADADGCILAFPHLATLPAKTAVTVSTDPFSEADVRPDASAVGRLAAGHFLSRGFTRFNYAGDPNDACADAFSTAARHAGGACTFALDAGDISKDGGPVACLTRSSTEGARWVSDARANRREVPADVAVLAIGDDKITCECAAVTVSAIDVGPARLGRFSAERLHRLLRDRDVPTRELIEPVAVIERESTATLAVNDADVVAAVRFIREHANGPLRVGDVLRASGLDRRTLERRFGKHFDRSPAEWIRRTRVDLAAKLLRETDLPLTEVARASGFRLSQHLAVAFKAIVGQTPSDYRASMTG